MKVVIFMGVALEFMSKLWLPSVQTTERTQAVGNYFKFEKRKPCILLLVI